MKILRRAIGTLLVVLILVVGTAGVLLGTAPGLNFVLKHAKDAISGELDIAAIDGGLFGRLHLKQISYRDETMQASVEEVILHWLPRALLQGQFHLAEFSLTSPRYVQLAASESPKEAETSPSEPLTLPDISLPVTIRLDGIRIDDFQYQAARDAEAVVVTRLLLVAAWDKQGIALDTLELEMPGIEAATHGTAQPLGNYPLDLRTKAGLSLPDLPKTEVSGRIQGNLEQLNIAQQATGDIQAQLSAKLTDVLGQLGLQADLNLDAFRLESVAPDTPGNINGELSARGDLAQISAAGQVRLSDAEALHSPWQADLKLGFDLNSLGVVIERLVVTQPDTPLLLDVTGSADADMNMDIGARWTSLQWPPSGPVQFGSENGTLDLKGTAEDYRLTLQALVAGSDIPTGEWNILGRGSQQGFTIETLTGSTLQGTLGAQGEVAWEPAVSWDATLKAEGINPGVKYPQWPGKLDLVLTSNGTIKDGNPQVTAVIDTLTGALRERALAGVGTIKMAGEEITIDALELTSGSAGLSADGKLGQQSDLSWMISISDMADLLPDASGSVNGKGRVSGPMTEPMIDGELSVAGMNYQDIAVEALSADLALDLSDRKPSDIKLKSQDIQIGQERIETLALNAAGRKTNHRLDAQIAHDLADLELRLRGAYDEDATSWQGSLEDLGIRSTDFGNWDLQQAVAIAAAPGRIKVDELCMSRESGSLCAQATQDNDTGAAELNAKGLQLSWLKGLLPPEIERLQGTVDLKADATLGKVPLLDAQLSIGSGELVIHPPAEELIALQHQGGLVKLELGKERVAVDFNLKIGEDGVKGRAQIPRGPFDQDPLTAPVTGNIDLQFRQLQLIAGLVPAIQELSGEILANLQLSGELGLPVVKGKASLVMPLLQVPEAGLILSNIAVNASSDDGKQIRLDGGISAGEGRLVLDGNIGLDPRQNWPVKVTLKGDDFQALNLPDRNLLITTDLAFDRTVDGMLLQGSIDIPTAYIVLDDVPEGAVSPSSDVIIDVGEQTPPPDKGAPFAMKVSVGLGEDVQFRGLGLKAYFTGKLTVNQTPGEFPTGSGEIKIQEGTYKAYGQDLIIDQGVVAYSGGRIDDPGLNIRAARETDVDLGNGEESVAAGVDVTGTAKKPNISVFSDPAMEQRDAISILLTGNTSKNIGKGGGNIGVNKELSKNLSVGARYDPSTSKSEIVTKYRFNRKFHVEAATSAESNAADVFYSLEFD